MHGYSRLIVSNDFSWLLAIKAIALLHFLKVSAVFEYNFQLITVMMTSMLSKLNLATKRSISYFPYYGLYVCPKMVTTLFGISKIRFIPRYTKYNFLTMDSITIPRNGWFMAIIINSMWSGKSSNLHLRVRIIFFSHLG